MSYEFVPAASSALLPGSIVRVTEDGVHYEASVLRVKKTGVLVQRKLGTKSESWDMGYDEDMAICKYRICDIAGKRVLHNVCRSLHECKLSIMGVQMDMMLTMAITPNGEVALRGNVKVEGIGSGEEGWVKSRNGSYLVLGTKRVARLEILDSPLTESDTASGENGFQERESALRDMEERAGQVEEREAALEVLEEDLRSRFRAMEDREKDIRRREVTLGEKETEIIAREDQVAVLQDKVENHFYGLKRKLQDAEGRNLYLELERQKYIMSDSYARPHLNGLAHSVALLKEELADLQKQITETKKQRLS